MNTAAATAAAIVTMTAIAVAGRGWYGVTKAAQLLGYDRSTLRRQIERGEVAAHRIGSGDYRISRVLVESMLAAQADAVNEARRKQAARVIRRSTPKKEP